MFRASAIAVVSNLLVLLPWPAAAEVADSADGGFTVEHRIELPVSRTAAYGAVADDVDRWWSSDHTVSGNAANLYIDAVPQGCFCERLGDGSGLVHLTVTFVNPGVILRLTGGLGPLGLMGVNGNLTLEFDDGEAAETSVITLRYAVGGYRPGGLGALAPAVDQVLGEQMERLRRHLESSHDSGAAGNG